MTTLATKLTSVCVYCGSNHGADPAYEAAARHLGHTLADQGIRLVYGGGDVGLMGTVARSALESGGSVTGIIPHFLEEREVMLGGVDELIVTADMHERKQLMFRKSDAFIALPGGIGTLEEVVEMMTWAQLGQHRKPVLLADVNGFWAPLLDLLNHMDAQGFLTEKAPFLVARNMEDVIPTLNEALAAETVEDARPSIPIESF